MITHKVEKLPKNTLNIVIDITWDEISRQYENAFAVLQKELSTEGFRKGKVPKSIAEKNISQDKIYQQLIKTFIPKIYQDIVQKESLQPIISPKIELIKAKDKEDWQISIKIALAPTITLGDYKNLIKNYIVQNKKADIWVPGQDKTKTNKDETAEKQRLLNGILSLFLKNVSMEISDLIIEEELNRRLAKLVDDIQKIGLTIESYLKSKATTIEELKQKYTQEIIDAYKIEFILITIADTEKIQVEKSDLDKLFKNITDEKERKLAEANSYFYASFLRKQKTLDFLISL